MGNLQVAEESLQNLLAVLEIDTSLIVFFWWMRQRSSCQTGCAPSWPPKKDDQTGVYFQNCKEVLEGFFGNLEVVTAEGFKRFLEQMDTSFTSGCWRQDTEACKKGWKYGTWGEDLFMQRTMDDAEVSKISDFSLSSSGTCPGDR